MQTRRPHYSDASFSAKKIAEPDDASGNPANLCHLVIMGFIESAVYRGCNDYLGSIGRCGISWRFVPNRMSTSGQKRTCPYHTRRCPLSAKSGHRLRRHSAYRTVRIYGTGYSEDPPFNEWLCTNLIGRTNWNSDPFLPSDKAVSCPP